MGQERHTRSLHEYWMIASRTRAFGIRHPCAERIQSRRQPSVRRRPQTRSPSLARARLLESFIRHHELHFVIGIVPLHVSRRLITAMPCGPSALNAREPPGCPQRLARCVAMWCDAQRRVVERCDAPRRAALPYRDVDKSYASHYPTFCADEVSPYPMLWKKWACRMVAARPTIGTPQTYGVPHRSTIRVSNLSSIDEPRRGPRRRNYALQPS
jgi:hypothetical protein